MVDVDIARTLMAVTFIFHLIFVIFGIGLPLVAVLVEQLGIRRKNSLIIEHAKRLSFVAAILVIAGVASGTIVAIQFTLIWGGLVEFAANVVGLAFTWEGYAFMIEAVFLALYVATWGKVKPWLHWFFGVMAAFGAFGSAFFITHVNAWMQSPGVLNVVGGVVQTTNPIADMVSKTAFYMISHSVSGYYLATILTVLSVYAFYLLRYKPAGKSKIATRDIMLRLALAGVVFIGISGVLGHFQTQYLAESQPRKFAVMELNETTQKNAPYIIGGHWNEDGAVEGGIRIPNMLSFMAGNSFDTEIKGLQDFPKDTWPMFIISTLFEVKMAILTLMAGITVLFAALHHKRLGKKLRDLRYSKPMLFGLLLVGPIAIVIVEFGWLIAEFGRQPFVVNDYLRTSEAYAGQVGTWVWAFPVLYVILSIITIVALRILLCQPIETTQTNQKEGS